MATAAGRITSVTPGEIQLLSKIGKIHRYQLKTANRGFVTEEERTQGLLVLPRASTWQDPVVKVGDEVRKKQLLARGVTRIFFQANIWVFTALSMLLGAVMGIGKAAVYKHIPDYFPADVGVVGGIVGVLGGLGGFICPVIFGYLLQATGLWTSCWMFFAVLVAICLVWMHWVIQRMMHAEVPALQRRIEQ